MQAGSDADRSLQVGLDNVRAWFTGSSFLVHLATMIQSNILGQAIPQKQEEVNAHPICSTSFSFPFSQHVVQSNGPKVVFLLITKQALIEVEATAIVQKEREVGAREGERASERERERVNK